MANLPSARELRSRRVTPIDEVTHWNETVVDNQEEPTVAEEFGRLLKYFAENNDRVWKLWAMYGKQALRDRKQRLYTRSTKTPNFVPTPLAVPAWVRDYLLDSEADAAEWTLSE